MVVGLAAVGSCNVHGKLMVPHPGKKALMKGNDRGYTHNYYVCIFQYVVFRYYHVFRGVTLCYMFLYCHLVLSRVRTLINGLFLIGNWCFFTPINGVFLPGTQMTQARPCVWGVFDLQQIEVTRLGFQEVWVPPDPSRPNTSWEGH